MKKFTLHIPKEIEAQLQKCRAVIRQSIRKRLQAIVETVAARPLGKGRPSEVQGPPLRFYVFEGYRVSYQVNPATRRVVVLKLRPESV